MSTSLSQYSNIKKIIEQQQNYSSTNSRPSTGILSKKNSTASTLNSYINQEITNNNNSLNQTKNQIYQSCKIQKSLQATYLRPESAQKINSNGLVVQFNELLNRRKNNRSQSLGNNIFLNNHGGEIIEDELQNEPILKRRQQKKQSSIKLLDQKQSSLQSESQNDDLHKNNLQVDSQKQLSSSFLKEKSIIQSSIKNNNNNKSTIIISKNKRSASTTNLYENQKKSKPIQISNLIKQINSNVKNNTFIDLPKQDNLMKEEKIKQQNENTIDDYFIQDSSNRKDRMEFIRENYYSNLKSMIQIVDRDYLILKSKEMFDVAFNTMKKVVEEYDLVIKELKGRIFRLNNENAELETTNDWLKRLNQQLEKQKSQITEEFEHISLQNKDLSTFKDSYILMQTKFSNITLEKLITNYEILDKKSFEYLSKVNILEDEKQQIQNLYQDSQDTINQLKLEIILMKQNKITSNENSPSKQNSIKKMNENNQNESNQININKQEYQIKQQSQRQYNELFNKILEIFNKLLEKQSILQYNNDDLKCNLDNPIDILNAIEKIVDFGNSKDLQNEMNKIIIAANKLYKLCYDESSASIFNTSPQLYDCEIIYNRVYSYLNSLKMNIQALKKQVASYKILIKS